MRNHLRPITAVLASLAIGLSVQSVAANKDEVTGRSTYVNNAGDVVHCVSTESGRTYCGEPHHRYVIVGTAPAECVRGKTWDFDDRGVWVSSGCRADFTVEADEVTSRSTYVSDSGRVVHCVSTESGRTYCGAYHAHYVISGTPDPVCVEGRTWGVDKHGIWVTGGCKGDFTYDDD